MESSAASAWEQPNLSHCNQSSLKRFEKLRPCIVQLSFRAYELERRKSKEGIVGRQLAPKVLFRVCQSTKQSGGSRGMSAAGEEPFRCPEVLLHSMNVSTGMAEADGAMAEVVNCASQFLRAACAFLETSRQGVTRGSGVMHGKRGVITSPESNDEAEGVFPYSSSSGVDACGRGEHVGHGRHSNYPESGLMFQLGAPPLYSSEDGISATTGEHRHRVAARGDDCVVGSIQEARVVFQIIMGTAFSCPTEPLAKAFQLVIAKELEQSLHPFEACCGVLKFLSPLDTTANGVNAERRRDENTGYLYFLNGEQKLLDLAEALSSSAEDADTIQWFMAPSASAVLPYLMRFLNGDLVELMEELQPAGDGTNEPVAWDALCRCHLNIPTNVLSDRNDLLYRIFFKMGEVPQYYNILSIYPDILRAHHATFQYIFFEEGPLPICERLMIALMAASRQKCEYLFFRFAALLLHFAEKQQSSDVVADAWLLQGPPPKLRALQRFIGIATHVPWQLKPDDIRGAMDAGWSIPDLFQASCIVAETLSLCSFVMGLFVPNDIWVSLTLPPSLSAVFSSSPAPGEVSHYESRVEFTRYTGIDDIVSENRIKGSSSNVFTLFSGTFNWHEHGGLVMEQYYPGAATLINNELDAFSAVIQPLNHSDCVGLTTPENSPSEAFSFLRLYVQNIIGFMPADYPYNSINKVLRRPAKLIAQSCTMRPETLLGSLMRLWVCMSSDPATATSEMSSARQNTTETADKQQMPELDMKEQKRQLIESITIHQAPFRLTMPGTEAGPRPQPREDVLQTALRLHEERLMLLIVLATMEARKEGLLALLLYPLWELLNNM